MTTRYQMKEMPDLQGTGEPITYPKMVMTGQTGTRELAEYIAMTSGFSKGVTEGIICELGEALAHEMGMGRSVKIEILFLRIKALFVETESLFYFCIGTKVSFYKQSLY